MRISISLLLLWCYTATLFAQTEVPAAPAPVRFDIARYEVIGNTLLDPALVEQSLRAYTGKDRDFGDVQRALEQLESLYQQAGYRTVYVTLPEQELNKGVVRFRVTEGRIGKVSVVGNQHFDEANVRRSLPALQEGGSPIAARLSENIQLANENPTKQVEVVLGGGDAEGEVNARVNVSDQSPLKYTVSFDNTGTPETGHNRTAFSLQHHNVAGLDHSLTLAYITSLDKPDDVQVDVYSVGYRIPLYSFGDSLDFVFVDSTTGVPSSAPSLGGALGIVGQGEIYGLRWNMLLPRAGEYTSRWVFALDGKNMESSCVTSGGFTLTGVGGCEPYYVRPLSATYHGKLEQARRMMGFNAGLSVNTESSSAESYDLASGGRRAPQDFQVGRIGGVFLQALESDWQIRINGQAQWTPNVLVPTEQIGLAGSTAVRGFLERAVATDVGHFVQSEIYTPELGAALEIPGNLRLMGFYDFARGKTLDAVNVSAETGIASIGLGLRYSLGQTVAWKLDLAHVLDSYARSTTDPSSAEDQWRVHFGLSLSY